MELRGKKTTAVACVTGQICDHCLKRQDSKKYKERQGNTSWNKEMEEKRHENRKETEIPVAARGHTNTRALHTGSCGFPDSLHPHPKETEVGR